MAKQQAQTTMTKDWLARMEQEEVELATKVRRVEMNLNNLFPSNIKELQVTQPLFYGLSLHCHTSQLMFTVS